MSLQCSSPAPIREARNFDSKIIRWLKCCVHNTFFEFVADIYVMFVHKTLILATIRYVDYAMVYGPIRRQ